MNRPPWFFFVIGHGLVVGIVFIGMFLAIGVWAAGSVSAMLPLGAIGIGVWVGRARTQVTRYREWHHKWAALAPNPAAARHGAAAETVAASEPRAPRHRTLWVVITICWLFLAATVKTPDQRAGLGGFTLLILGYWVVVLLARLLRKKAPPAPHEPPADDMLVSQCVTHTLYTVPSLGAAYQHLPGYCLQTLQTGGH